MSSRPARRHPGAILIGLLGLLFGLAFIAGGIGAWLTDTAITRSGDTATGVVLEKQIAFAADGMSTFDLRYRFALPDGREITTYRSITKQAWEGLSVGDPLVVHYDPEQTSRNFPAGEGVTSVGMVVFACVIGLLLAVFGALLLAGGLKPRVPED